MRFLGNLIWLIFGGFIIAIEYFIGSMVLMITIVGIPFGIQTLKMAALAIWPFGRDTRVHYRASGCLYILMNILWLITGWFMDCRHSCNIWNYSLYNNYWNPIWNAAFQTDSNCIKSFWKRYCECIITFIIWINTANMREDLLISH